MRFKRLLALLLAAALALSLLAGCGGGKNQSLSQMLLNLLDGQYQNVSVEIDSDLEAKLRQAISQSETDEELRAALEQLLGGGISFQRLGSGQQGDSAWTLIIYPGTDPDAAARSVYLDLDKVFAALPDDGVYSSGFAMAEMENGYAILVRATVDKAGTEDKPDPVTLESIKVTKNPKLEYWVGESFNPAGMEITATYSNNTTKTLKDIKKNGDQGVKWTPETFDSDGTKTVTISYGEKNTTVSVTVKEPEVEKIEVSGYINTYTEGQSFNPSGMKVTVTYDDNSIKTISNIKQGGDQGVTWKPDRALTTSDTSITITYTENGKGSASADVSITVQAKPVTLQSITVTGPDKIAYEIDETFDPTGMVVTAYYSNGSNTIINNYTITDKDGQTVGSSYTFTTAGSYTLTVTYTEGAITKTGTIIITVSEDKGYTVSEDGNTYEVYNAEGLKNIAELVNGGKTDIDITLTADITLPDVDEGESNWTPIGTSFSNPYIGTFDGNGKTITGLTVDQKETGNVGLIGYLGSGGKVQNLTLENVNLNGDWYVGGVVGYSNNGTVTACTASGSINGKEYVGGIVGSNYLGTVTACYNTSSTVNGSYLVGGVVGQNNKGIVTACYNASGSIYGEVTVGGVVGINSQGTVTACYSTGDVSGNEYTGGVVGWNNGTVNDCYWSGSPDNDNGGATKVDGQSVTWQKAVDAMNTALSGDGWQYELIGALPTLKKTNP